jgi:hypothetical protein
MTLVIRGYRDEDFAAVVELWTACHLLQPHHDPKRELAFVRAATNAELFLAFEEERLAGSIHVGATPTAPGCITWAWHPPCAGAGSAGRWSPTRILGLARGLPS